MHTALAISPHADDAAAFIGGTLAKFASDGWNVVLVRVTDDCRDSLGLTVKETITRNTQELHSAAGILGIREIVELGYETDCLADVSKVALREKFVRLFRKYRPYAVFSFDPFGLHEGNMDHIVVAQAVEESFWVSCFDLHHPEHLKEGLQPFAVCERWYYGRELPGANMAVDVTAQIDTAIEALAAHKTMMRNMINQLRMQAATWGRVIPPLEDAFENDVGPMVEWFLRARMEAEAQRFALPEGSYAETFRFQRFGAFEPFFLATGEAIPGAPQGPDRVWRETPAPL